MREVCQRKAKALVLEFPVSWKTHVAKHHNYSGIDNTDI